MQKQDRKDHSEKSGESKVTTSKTEKTDKASVPANKRDDKNIDKNFNPKARQTLQNQYDEALNETDDTKAGKT